MLRIHNIEKLEGAKLDKRNMVINKVKAISIVDGPDYGEYYEFILGAGTWDRAIVRLDREYHRRDDDVPIYQMFNTSHTNIKVDVTIDMIKNKDIFIDKLRLVGIV